jgi:hypothetical protein
VLTVLAGGAPVGEQWVVLKDIYWEKVVAF